MKWTIKVVSETESGHTADQTLVAVERTDRLTVEDLGLSLAEAKRLLATLQRSIVTAQWSFACLPVHDGGLVAPDWLFQAKRASLIPFARVADPLADVLPAGDGGNAETVRSRLARVGGRLYEEKVQRQETPPAPQDVPAFRIIPGPNGTSAGPASRMTRN